MVEEGGKAVRVERGRRNDHLEFASAREYALEDAQKEIHVQRTLVGFVDDDGIVGAQERIVARLGEQDAVSHERDARFIRDLPSIAVPIADDAADRRGHFGGDARGHGDGGESAGLGAGDATALGAIAQLQQHLRELGRLAGAGVAADDNDGAAAQGGENLLAMRADRQFGRVAE